MHLIGGGFLLLAHLFLRIAERFLIFFLHLFFRHHLAFRLRHLPFEGLYGELEVLLYQLALCGTGLPVDSTCNGKSLGGIFYRNLLSKSYFVIKAVIGCPHGFIHTSFGSGLLRFAFQLVTGRWVELYRGRDFKAVAVLDSKQVPVFGNGRREFQRGLRGGGLSDRIFPSDRLVAILGESCKEAYEAEDKGEKVFFHFIFDEMILD